ncbi:MAG: hypothetical protein ACOYS2_01745 [Patescibacteria group bacterium]
MFHPDENVPRGTFGGAGVEHFNQAITFFVDNLGIAVNNLDKEKELLRNIIKIQENRVKRRRMSER